MKLRSVNYRIDHRTAYAYAAPVTLSHQRLHLTPREMPFQKLRTHQIDIRPEVAHRLEGLDPFGNPLVEVTIESAHRTLEVVARSAITITARDWPDPRSTPPWESVRDALSYRANWHADTSTFEATQYLFESPHVRIKRMLRAYGEDCFSPNRPILEAAEALMNKLHREFKFAAGATSVTTPVMAFFEQRSGVCQDFTHLMISCLRSLGLPARYMSGYLATSERDAEAHLVGADASHAWVALLIPGSGWVELDPTNNVRPSLQHVILGWGRDFSDITPLRGVINAGCEQSLEVRVVVVPEANQ